MKRISSRSDKGQAPKIFRKATCPCQVILFLIFIIYFFFVKSFRNYPLTLWDNKNTSIRYNAPLLGIHIGLHQLLMIFIKIDISISLNFGCFLLVFLYFIVMYNNYNYSSMLYFYHIILVLLSYVKTISIWSNKPWRYDKVCVIPTWINDTIYVTVFSALHMR